MKRIVFVLPGLGIGGVERSFLGLLRYAPKEELDVTLILFSKGGALLDEVPDWVHVQYASNLQNTESLRRRISTLLKKLGFHRLFTVAKSVYHKIGPKLIHPSTSQEFDVAIAYSDGMATWYVSKSIQAQKKIAFVHTDFLSANYNAETEGAVYQEFQQIFFGSVQSMNRFLQALPELQEKTAVLTSCIDWEHIQTQAKEPCDSFDRHIINLSTVGRLSHEKGMDKIPALLSLMKSDGLSVHWHVIGDGPERENLLAAAKKLGVEADLTLYGALKNPYPYLSQCDIYVQPSNYEGYCIALAEARALGKPCVACDFSGAREQIHNEIDGFVTGMAVPEIYSGLKRIVEDSQMRLEFSNALLTKDNTLQQESFRSWWQML